MGRMFAELKRRKVFQVAGVYAVTAWLLAQGLALVLETYGAPAWVQPTLIAILIAGLPLAIILAWAFEVTPEGVRRTENNNTAKGPSSSKITYVLLALVIIAVAGLFYRQEFETSEAPLIKAEAPAEALDLTVAVLPFANLSPDPENAYFAAGLHEEVLNQLVRAGRVSVIARTSVQQYLGTSKTIPVIASELGVANVLEGSVRYAGNEVRITAQLNDGASGLHLWSQTWDRKLENIFALQSEVAEAVADAMNAELNPDVSATSDWGTTENVEAYDLYLQILANRTSLTDLSFPEILKLSARAIELDPEFLSPYWFRANAYLNALGGQISSIEGTELARRDIEKMLAINPNSASAWDQMRRMHENNFDWSAAEASAQHATELDPHDSGILASYARLLLVLDRGEEAVPLAEKASQLEPLGPWETVALADVYRATGRLDEASKVEQRMIDTGINPLLNLNRFHGEAMAGDFAAARDYLASYAEARERLRGSGSDMAILSQQAWLAAMEGDHVRSREILHRLEQERSAHAIKSWNMLNGYNPILAHVALGDFDPAFMWLDRIVEGRDWSVLRGFIVEPVYVPLRADARFADIRRRMGLDP